MEAKVVRWGDDLVVRLSHAEAEILGIREGETVEIMSKRSAPPEVPERVGRPNFSGIPVFALDDMIAEARRLGPEAEPPTVEWGPDRGSEIIDDDRDPY